MSPQNRSFSANGQILNITQKMLGRSTPRTPFGPSKLQLTPRVIVQFRFLESNGHVLPNGPKGGTQRTFRDAHLTLLYFLYLRIKERNILKMIFLRLKTWWSQRLHLASPRVTCGKNVGNYVFILDGACII